MNLKKKIRNFFTLSPRANGGFTLVELIVVIAILAILAGVAVPAYSGYIKKAEQAADEQLLAALNTAYAAACMENGEYDMRALSFNPVATLSKTGVTMNQFDDSFQRYFEGNGAFKYFDTLGYNSQEGVFMGNTVAQLMNMMKEAWENSTFGNEGVDSQAVLSELSRTFNIFSEFFSGNHSMFPDGFSIDGVIATLPSEVQNAFGFGSYDITPEQQEQLLSEYVEGYAGWDDEKKAQWKEENAETVNNIKGNAYVMNIANAANSGVTAAGIKNDISALMAALQDTSNYSGDAYEALKEACGSTELDTYGLTAEVLAAVGVSGVKNESGISTLGSMYALAAGYLNSDEYKNSGDTTLKTDITDFGNVLAAMQHTGFDEYLNGKKDEEGNRITAGNAVNDIDAYLNYMKYISANGVEMENGGAFTALGNSAWEVIGGAGN